MRADFPLSFLDLLDLLQVEALFVDEVSAGALALAEVSWVPVEDWRRS